MIVLILQQFGGGGSGSGKVSEGQNTYKLGNEISKQSEINKKDQYVLFTNRMEQKGLMTGEAFLERINKGVLTLDRETGMWRGSKGLYVVRRLVQKKSSSKKSNKEKEEKKKTNKKTTKKTTKKTGDKK